jgi:hypothetical protein
MRSRKAMGDDRRLQFTRTKQTAIEKARERAEKKAGAR